MQKSKRETLQPQGFHFCTFLKNGGICVRIEKIKYNIKNFKKISYMEDFYKKIGLEKANDYSNIYIDKENCRILDEYIRNNAIKQLQIVYSQKYCDLASGLDWLLNSPKTSIKDIPKNEIWIIKED